MWNEDAKMASISYVAAPTNAMNHAPDDRTEFLNALRTLIPTIIGNVNQFNGMFGPSNPLDVIKYPPHKVGQSKCDFVDIAYKFNHQYNVLVGPINFFGLCPSNDKIKTAKDMEQAVASGDTKLMAYLPHFDALQDPESAALLSAIVGDLYTKMDDMMRNENRLAQITERYPKFDKTAYERSRTETFKKYTIGQCRSDASSDIMRLGVSITPCKPNRYSCYEISEKVSRAKNYMHFYPPLKRRGYLLLKMPYIRAIIKQSTEFTIKLHANYIFADIVDILHLPLCFDMISGLEVNDETVEPMEDSAGEADIDGDSEMEKSQPFDNPVEVLSSTMTVDDMMNFGEVDLPFTPLKQLSTSMLDYVKSHEDADHPLNLHLFENFVNTCIRYLKKTKVPLRNRNGSTVINSRIPEYNAPSGGTLKTLTTNIKHIYDKYRLTTDVSSAFDCCWNEIFSPTTNSKRRRERSETPAVATAEPKPKATKVRK